MKWRGMVELGGMDGVVQIVDVGAGGRTAIELSPATLGLTLEDGKQVLARLRSIWLERRRKSIAAAEGAVRVLDRSDRSKTCASGS